MPMSEGSTAGAEGRSQVDGRQGSVDRWRALVLLSVAQLLGMSLWFTGSAAAPALRDQWALTSQQAGWLTTVVQLGFVAGTAVAALLNLADVVSSRRYFVVSALLGASFNALLLFAPGLSAALLLRFCTGFALAGVYPPAMKMVATWFRSARGLAIGTVDREPHLSAGAVLSRAFRPVRRTPGGELRRPAGRCPRATTAGPRRRCPRPAHG